MNLENKDTLKKLNTLDEETLSQVFDEYYQPIYRYILMMVNHTPVAEDLSSEVFLKLLDKIKEGKGPRKNIKSWLYRVAHNTCVDHSRKPAQNREFALDQEILENLDFSETIHSKLFYEEVLLSINDLSIKQRTVILMKYLEGFTLVDISKILGISNSSAKVLHHRGIKRLREKLPEHIYTGI